MTKTNNIYVKEDLVILRDEIQKQAFDSNGRVLNYHLAEVVYKINSCLYNGYKYNEV